MKITFPTFLKFLGFIVVGAAFFIVALRVGQWFEQTRVLNKVIERLSADTRIATVLVTKSEWDETAKKIRTTIKFLEYDAAGQPLEPKYFTFQGNVIQFQSLVIRFDDKLVRSGEKLRGKSAYIFLKAFVLDDKGTQVFDITESRSVPAGYKVSAARSEFEAALWEEFWSYALDPKTRHKTGVKNAQLEAPGSMFLPGTIYTLRIEHDGGIRIDTEPIPDILKGETVS